MKKLKNRNNGITLISLVVTIIILLIIATVSIFALTGENGIITRTKKTKGDARFAQYKDEVDMYFANKKIEMKQKRAQGLDVTDENMNVTDSEEIKRIVPDMKNEDVDKFEIKNGQLVYKEENVDNEEENAIAGAGVAVATGATIIFIANGREFDRITSDKVKFSLGIPTNSNNDDFYGWYYDQERTYQYKGDENNNAANKAEEGDDIDGEEITLYAVFHKKQDRPTCLAEGTRVTLEDGNVKNIEEITYEDKLLVWNFDEGKFDTSKPIWIMKEQTVEKYTKLKFDNGIELNLSEHRIFNVDKQKFTHAHIKEETPVGTTVFMEDGTSAKITEIVEIEKEINVYNVMTEKHINIFANGILTSLRFNDIYDIQNMKYVIDDRELNKKEDYPNIPEKYFEGLRLAEQRNTIEKSGKVWWEERVENVIMKKRK